MVPVQSCLVGIVVPDPEVLPNWAKKKGIQGEFKDLCKNTVGKGSSYSKWTIHYTIHTAQYMNPSLHYKLACYLRTHTSNNTHTCTHAKTHTNTHTHSCTNTWHNVGFKSRLWHNVRCVKTGHINWSQELVICLLIIFSAVKIWLHEGLKFIFIQLFI